MIDDSDSEPKPARSKSRLIYGGLFAAALGAAAWLLFAPRGALEPEPPPPPSTVDTAPVARQVTLYFGDREARGVVAEEREVEAGGSLDARIAAVIRALIEGPQGGDGVRTLPADTQLRRVFLDDEEETVYLDFDPALVTHHPGGTAGESITLDSIVRTLAANFPELARVQLLVEGEPVETLAGHVDTSQPIEIATWK